MRQVLVATSPTGCAFMGDVRVRNGGLLWAVGAGVNPGADPEAAADAVMEWIASAAERSGGAGGRELAARVIVPSGTLDPDGGEDPRNWGAAGWAALARFCDRVRAAVAGTARAEVLFRTDALHILSDVPSSLRFLRQAAEASGAASGGVRFGIVFDPVAMLRPSMLPDADDHLARMFAALGGAPGVAAVALTGLRSGAGEGLERSALANGASGHVSAELLAGLLARHVAPETPLIVEASLGDPDAQAEAGGC